MNGGMLHLQSAGALGDADGMKAYIDDMHKIGTILDTPGQAFSWWTAVFLVLILLAWCAALITAWILLHRRIGRNSTAPPHAAAVIGEFAPDATDEYR